MLLLMIRVGIQLYVRKIIVLFLNTNTTEKVE